MKRFALLLCGSAALACAADLANVRSVYVMPMSRGFDQYIANRITNGHIFQVVTDPKRADAILTDRIGQAFEIQLEKISPPPEPPKPAKPAKAAEKADDKSADKGDQKSSDNNPAAMFADTEKQSDAVNAALSSSFGRGKGTIFLVWAKSREVVWSIYDPPKSSSSKDMDRTASDIVASLKKDLNPKEK